jgi:hypothetical protein
MRKAAMLPPFLIRRIAMMAMFSMKLTFSDALAAFATIVSLSGILYVLYVIIKQF